MHALVLGKLIEGYIHFVAELAWLVVCWWPEGRILLDQILNQLVAGLHQFLSRPNLPGV